MPGTATATDELTVGTPVVATVDMRGVPQGSAGKVIHVQGLSWIRYWVRFDNGQRVGTLGRTKLATPAEWERRHDVAVPAVASGTLVVADTAASAGNAMADVGGVPGHLLERSRAARARFAAKNG